MAPELDFATFNGTLTIGDTAVDFSNSQTAVRQIMSAYLAKATGVDRVLPVIADDSLVQPAKNALNALNLQEFVTP